MVINLMPLAFYEAVAMVEPWKSHDSNSLKSIAYA